MKPANDNSKAILFCLAVVILTAPTAFAQATPDESRRSEEYLSWNLKQAEKIGQSTVKESRSGSSFDFRIMSQDKAYQIVMEREAERVFGRGNLCWGRRKQNEDEQKETPRHPKRLPPLLCKEGSF